MATKVSKVGGLVKVDAPNKNKLSRNKTSNGTFDELGENTLANGDFNPALEGWTAQEGVAFHVNPSGCGASITSTEFSTGIAGKAGEVFSTFKIDNNTISDDFVFARASFATRVNENGLIETPFLLGADIVQNGNFATDISGWTKGSGTTNPISWDSGKMKVTNDVALLNSARQSVVTVIGKTYLVTADVDSTNGVNPRLSTSNPTTAIEGTGGTIETLSYTFVATSTFSEINLYNWQNTLGAYNLWDNISIQEVLEDDLPRIDYSGSTFDIPVLGNELIDYSALSSSTSSWSLVNGKWFFEDITNGYITTEQFDVVVGEQYEITVDVSIASGNANFRITSGNAQTILFNYTGFPNGVTKFITTVDGADGAVNRIYAPINLTDNPFTLNSISIKKVTAYTTTDKGSFLLEPASTNLVDYSEDFSQWNAIDGIAVTQNDTISPDGTSNAARLDFNPSLTTSRIEVPVPSGGAGDFIFSVWAKSVSGNDVPFGMEIGSANSPEQQRVATSEWQRFYRIGDTASSVNIYPQIEAWTTNNESIYIWGAQMEELPYATSYIPTNGSIVTRAQESCSKSNLTTDGLWGGSVGTILLHTTEMQSNATSLNTFTPFRLYRYTGDRYRWYYDTDAAFIGNAIDMSDEGGELKMAFSVSDTDIKLYVNGTLRGTHTIVTTPSDGQVWSWAPETKYKESLADFKIYDKALSDDQLADLTAVNPADRYKITISHKNPGTEIIVRFGSEKYILPVATQTETTSFYLPGTPAIEDLEIVPFVVGEKIEVSNILVESTNPNDEWTLGTGWSIADNKATSNGTASNLDQSGVFLSGKTYKVTFDVLNYVSGDIRFRFTGASNENGTIRDANGTYTEYITLTNTQSVFRFPSSAFNGSIDNVSIQEVLEQDITYINKYNLEFTTDEDSVKIASEYLEKTIDIPYVEFQDGAGTPITTEETIATYINTLIE